VRQPAVRNVLDLDVVERPDSPNHRVPVFGIGALERDAARLMVGLDTDQIDPAEESSGAADRVGHLSE
jgi:hypothetical protein